MNKYLVLYHDQWEPDSGTPLHSGVEVTRSGSRELSATDVAATGYSIISAASREEAEALLADCPYAASVRLYEAQPM